MRHLIDTYIEAGTPRRISPFDDLSLLALIVKTGIADAVAERLANLKGNREAVAETIENNVRSKILQDHLNDPAYYEKMSALLDELIQTRKAKAVEYEAYLQQIAELAAKVETGHTDETSQRLDTPGKRALYNMLTKLRQDSPSASSHVAVHEPTPTGLDAATGDAEEALLGLAVQIHETVQRVRPDGWRGNRPKERVIQGALFTLLGQSSEVEQVFPIIQSQPEYWG
jgi:type I restriction enzyme R subunit